MEWTRQKLAQYLGRVRAVVEFEGITGDELAQAFEGEAMLRLKQVQAIVYHEEQTDEEKLKDIMELVSIL